MLGKKELRQNAIQRRRQMSLDEIQEKSSQVIALLVDFLKSRNFDSIFLYYPFKGEVNLMGLLDSKLKLRTAFPKVNGSDLDFYLIQSQNQLSKQAFGIMEPSEFRDLAVPSVKSLILVPSLLLDRKGNRLGLGKGFYDRYLSRVKTSLTLGVAFHEFLKDDLPVEPWDVPLDGFMTEEKIEILSEIHK
jgi:5-formyltetrahydrofolate cyclo-ligase